MNDKELSNRKELATFKFKLAEKIAKLRHKNKMEEIESEKNARMEADKFKEESMKSLHRLKRADLRREHPERYT